MNKQLLQKAIDHIERPDTMLGMILTFYVHNGKPCCAVGHMAAVAGISPEAVADDYDAVTEAYGLPSDAVDRIWRTNDRGYSETPEDSRKQAILDLLKGWLEEEESAK